MNKLHKELLFKHKKQTNNYLDNKKIITENEILSNSLFNSNSNKKNNLNIIEPKINNKELNYKLIIDDITYILKKEFFNCYNNKNRYITYKEIDNNNNYRSIWPKKYLKICYLCGEKLITNIDNLESTLYYCKHCDKIELNYNSIIYLNNKKIDIKSIIWNEKILLTDEINTINSTIYFLDINNYIFIEKKIINLIIDNITHSIIWYYKNEELFYAFIKIPKNFEIYNNSKIFFNDNILNIYLSKYDNSYYKLFINEIILSGNRYRPDLCKLLN